MEFIIQNTTMKVTQLAAVASTSSWIANNITTTVLTIAVVLLGTFVVRFNRYREFEIKRVGSIWWSTCEVRTHTTGLEWIPEKASKQ